jgi:hypothetical protein
VQSQKTQQQESQPPTCHLADLDPLLSKAFAHIAAMDGMQAARGGAPILFSLGIIDPVTWWGEPSELGNAIIERIKTNNHVFHQRWVDAATEIVSVSPAAHEPAFLAACILRMAATELVAIKGMQRKMVGL